MNYSKDMPDPSIDWDFIQYNNRSDSIRPEPGYRVCTKCGKILPVNTYYFSRDRRNADGYCYQCKECQKKHRKENKNGKR